MKCQQCNVNRATVNMAMQINNERLNIHLCSTCFNEIKNQMGQSGNFSGDLSSHPFFQGQMNGQGENQANQGSYTRTQERDAKKKDNGLIEDRKSTRLNSSHVAISYAVFCLKKKSK